MEWQIKPFPIKMEMRELLEMNIKNTVVDKKYGECSVTAQRRIILVLRWLILINPTYT